MLALLSAILSVLLPAGFVHLDSENSGLSDDVVRCVLRDSRGYVWTGTQMGLNRYDGKRMRRWFAPEIPSNYIFSLCEDLKGNVWVGTAEGVSVYDYFSDSVFSPLLPDGSVPDGKVLSIACSPSGEVWLDTGLGSLYSYDYEKGVLEEHPLGVPAGRKNLAFDSRGRLYVAHSLHNLYRYRDGELVECCPANNYFVGDELQTPLFSPESDDLVYIVGKRTGLSRVDLRRKTVEKLMGWKTSRMPRGAAISEDSRLFVATTGGLVVFDLATGRTSVCAELGDESLSSVCTLGKGGFVAGTSRDGLLCLTGRESKFSTARSEECFVRAIAMTPSSEVYAATEKNGLMRCDRDTGKLIPLAVPGLPNFLTDVVGDGSCLWIGTQYGIKRLDLRTMKVRDYTMPGSGGLQSENRVVRIFLLQDGTLYVSTASCFLEYDRTADAFKVFSEAGTRAYHDFAQGADGAVWLGSYASGLFRFDPSDHSTFASVPGCPCKMISSLSFDSAGKLWVTGSEGMLYACDTASGEFSRFSLAAASGHLAGALQGGVIFGRELLLASTSGLLVYDTSGSGTLRYSSRDGLANTRLGRMYSFEQTGEVAVCSAGGVTFFSPEDVCLSGNSAEQGRTDITALYIGDDPVSPSPNDSPIACNINLAKEIRLVAAANHFAIELATPLSWSPACINCMLEGYDAAPRNVSGDGRISWFDIPPGEYVLHVSSHPDIRVFVSPPFWRSTAGILLLALIALLVGSVAGLVAVIYARRRESERIEKEKMGFLSDLVHEIKTPLTVIATPLKSLQDSSSLSDEDKSNLDLVIGGVRSLRTLSREILEFIRSEENAYTILPKRLDFAETVGSVCFNFSALCKEKGIALNFKAEDDVFVDADEKALMKIVGNLLDNACKYAFSRIDMTISHLGNFAELRIANDGRTIPESKRDEVFRKFSRLEEGDTVSSHSFGIGLPFARTLARLHGGSLELSDCIQTEFVLRLPCSKAVSPKDCQPDDAVFSQGSSGRTLLVVEDSRELGDFLLSKLSPHFNVLRAYSGKEALSKMGSNHVDVVLTDIRMPQMDGIEFCTKLRGNPRISDIPVIVMSAVSSEEDKIRSIAAGANYYIEKPFTLDYLCTVIDSLTSKGDAAPDTGAAGPDADAVFIRNLEKVVEENYSDDHFGPHELEEKMFMSHSSLNRKMGSVLGSTPVEYIKAKRLREAARLIETDASIPLSEVAFRVGFASVTYFSKCYKDFFGTSPGKSR